MKTAPAIILSVFILLTPLFIWTARRHPAVWTERLLWPPFTLSPALHTPLFDTGYFLPARISQDLTIQAGDGPVILSGTTRVAPGATLTIKEGTTLVAGEFASLQIAGRLNIEGTNERPVTFSSNEANAANQVWSGLAFLSGSEGNINHAVMSDGAPNISCLKDSRVTVQSSRLKSAVLDAYIESDHCRFLDSRLQSERLGIQAVGVKPDLINTTIAAARK